MFICIAKTRFENLDTYNRWRSETHDLALSAPALEGLYEAIAQARIRYTWTDADEWGDDSPASEKSSISFGHIHRISESMPLDEAVLRRTAAWRSHEAEVEAARARREQAEAEAAQAEAEQETLMEQERAAADLAAYERVKASLEAGVPSCAVASGQAE